METVKALRSQRASDCKRNECGNVKNENRKKREDYYGVFRQIYYIVYRDDVQSSFLSLWTSFVATQAPNKRQYKVSFSVNRKLREKNGQVV